MGKSIENLGAFNDKLEGRIRAKNDQKCSVLRLWVLVEHRGVALWFLEHLEVA